MAADVELLSLPSVLLNWPHPTNHVAIRDYARACVEANTEALRAEVGKRNGIDPWAVLTRAEQAEARAERLAEALREARHYVDGNKFPGIVAKIDALCDHAQQEGAP